MVGLTEGGRYGTAVVVVVAGEAVVVGDVVDVVEGLMRYQPSAATVRSRAINGKWRRR